MAICFILMALMIIPPMFAFAAGKTKKYDKYINYRAPLTHTYNRLKNDKELNIVYFGGSVTAGYGSTNAAYSWRGLSMKWFSEKFPDANINFINTAIGESGTYLGTFRVKQDVINQNPDLLFIEYAINDTYKGSSKDQAALQYETIVREVRTALPNCDIVTLLVTDKERSKSLPELYPTAAGHEKIAKAYNIPTINVGAALVDSLKNPDKEWSKYFIDTVHPSDAGYKKYYDCLEEYLNNSLLYTDYSGLKEGHKMPKLQSKNLLDGTRMSIFGVKMRSYLINSKGFRYSYDLYYGPADTPHNGYYYSEGNTDSEITFRFFGTEFAIWTNFYKKSTVTISVDGGEEESVVCDSHAPTLLAKELAPGNHYIVIKPTVYGDSDQMKIGAIFFRDDTKQTGKAVDPATREPEKETGTQIKKHNHSYAGYSSDGDVHFRQCECGEVKDWAYHNFGKWEHIEGNEYNRTCSVCKYVGTFTAEDNEEPLPDDDTSSDDNNTSSDDFTSSDDNSSDDYNDSDDLYNDDYEEDYDNLDDEDYDDSDEDEDEDSEDEDESKDDSDDKDGNKGNGKKTITRRRMVITYSYTPLFWILVIGGPILLIAGIVVLIIFLKKRKKRKLQNGL